MHKDARITLYGGVPITFGVAALGHATGNRYLAITGYLMALAMLVVVFAFDWAAERADTRPT